MESVIVATGGDGLFAERDDVWGLLWDGVGDFAFPFALAGKDFAAKLKDEVGDAMRAQEVADAIHGVAFADA